jgi:aminoglycoside 2'-N-acetyltransferase I
LVSTGLELEQFTTAEAGDDRLAAIHHVLEAAFGDQFDGHDWEHALGGTHVVAMDDGVLVAHAAVVSRIIEVDGHPFRTGYVEAVATLPHRQGTGLGSAVMAEVERIIREGYELGALSTGSQRFYGGFGWDRWKGATYVRHGDEVIPSEDDDASVMVLRFGPSAGVDLTSSISCEAREGDDW